MKSGSVVKLRVDNVAARRKRRRSKKARLIALVRDSAERLPGPIAGCTLVLWDKDWNAAGAWIAKDSMPSYVVPEFTKKILEAEMARARDEDLD